MRYTYIHYFSSTMGIPEERALEIAKEGAAKDFGKMLLENAKCEIRDDGSIRITVDI